MLPQAVKMWLREAGRKNTKQSPRVSTVDYTVWISLGFSCDCVGSEDTCLMAQGCTNHHFLPCVTLVFRFNLDYHHQVFVPSIVPLRVDSIFSDSKYIIQVQRYDRSEAAS